MTSAKIVRPTTVSLLTVGFCLVLTRRNFVYNFLQLSNAHSPDGTSLIECDRSRQYAHPPNTLCLVHIPGRHGNITSMSNSRYGLVVSCDDDIIRFRDPAKAGGPYFESKNFSEIKLAPGVSPHRFIGVQSPDGPPPKVCLPSCPEDRLPNYDNY